MKHILIPFLSCLLIMSGCTGNNDRNKGVERVVPVLDIAGNMSASVPGTFTWNSLAKSTRIIPLSTEQLLGGSLGVIYISDDMIIINDNQQSAIFCYDSKGNLLHHFGHKGQGPGEYANLGYANYNVEEKSITIFDDASAKLLTYTLDGKCLEEKVIDKWVGKATHITHIDGDYTYINNTSDGSSLISVLDKDYKTVGQYFDFDSTATAWDKTFIAYFLARSNTTDKYLINRSFDDTVYVLDNAKLLPVCVLNKGTHSLPKEEVAKFMEIITTDNNYFTSTNVNVFSSYLFYTYLCQGEIYYDLWNMDNQTKIAAAKCPKKERGTAGFKLLLDSGKELSLFPRYFTDKYLLFFIPASDYMDEIQGMKEDDNPVLLVMELK